MGDERDDRFVGEHDIQEFCRLQHGTDKKKDGEEAHGQVRGTVTLA